MKPICQFITSNSTSAHLGGDCSGMSGSFFDQFIIKNLFLSDVAQVTAPELLLFWPSIDLLPFRLLPFCLLPFRLLCFSNNFVRIKKMNDGRTY